jgi:enamine deaminase RidA (YjgF/YER057c/UK114 family)
MITRLAGSAAGRSSAVIHAGLVFTVATAKKKSPSLREQTRDALAALDARLAQAGSDKSRILSATVYIADMTRKAEMNEAWMEWVDPDNAPQRACIGAALEGDDLIEIVVIAAANAAS